MAEGEKRPFIRLFWDIWDDKRITINEKNVLTSLLRHYNTEKRRAWPSYETIAYEIDRSRVFVWRALKTLEAKGYIRTEKHVGKVTMYELPFLSRPVSDVNSTHFKSERVEEQPISEFNTTHFKSESVPISEVNATRFKSEPEQDKRTKSIRTRSIEQEGRLLSPDPWIRDRLSEICQVVNAPKPANLDLLIGQWRETYGESTVEQTILKALRWMQDNDRRYKDMGRFLGNWLARDAARNAPVKTARRVNYGDTLPSWDEIRREENRR